MAAVSAFRSDAGRAAYLKLYDAALATSTIPVTESDVETRVWSLLGTLVIPANRRLLRQEPWQPIYQQFVGGAMYFKMSLRNAEPRPWPLRSDCDLQRVASSRMPVLAIIGRDETAHNGPKTATNFRQQLPEARIELVDDACHGVLQDQPEIVEKLLAEFLQ